VQNKYWHFIWHYAVPVFNLLYENFKSTKMKKFFVIIVTVTGLISCSKQVSTPQGAASQNMFFQNANVVVEDMAAKPTATNTVTISFTTLFQNNISHIELMSGTTVNNFCTAQSVDISNSVNRKSYSFTDTSVKAGTMYYLLRFKNNSGEYAYSSYVTVQVP
jgi:PBP1b-binding outer membrane lipoprotein LpoB